MTAVHVVVPETYDDPQRPSGGNVYDRRLCDGLARLDWVVRVLTVPVAEPGATADSRRVLDQALATVPDGEVAVVDGLVGSRLPEVVSQHASRIELVGLVHMAFGSVDEAATAATRASEAAFLEHCSRIVTTSQWTRRWLREHYRLPGDPFVIEPGADPEDLVEGTDSGVRLLCVAAVTPAKGQDVLVEALAGLRQLDWTCACVGSTQIDPTFAAEVAAAARRHDIGDRVRLHGPLSGPELASAFADADLLLLPSRTEGYGMVVTEALARGLPVVASEVGGVSEALGGGQPVTPGVLVRPEDPAVLGRELRRRLAHRAARPGPRPARRARPMDDGRTALRRGLGHPDLLTCPALNRSPRRPVCPGKTRPRRASWLPAYRTDGRTAIDRSTWRWLRLAGALLILGALLFEMGADPFVDGLRQTTPALIAAATAITVVTTSCSAWRWSLVSARLGVPIPLRAAVAAYYRSLLVNMTLPGGVLGDVHRAVRHGHNSGDLGNGVRGVVWERGIGQVVQIAGTLVVVAAVHGPLRPAALIAAAAAAIVGLVLWRTRWIPAFAHRTRPGRAVAADGRAILGAVGPRRAMVLASAVTVGGHTSIFLLAAHTAGVRVTWQLVPIAMVVLLGAAIPMSVAGWGPREATAAGAFATAGLGAGQGVTVAVVYGVVALVATLPGALLLRWRPPTTVEVRDGAVSPRPELAAGEVARG